MTIQDQVVAINHWNATMHPLTCAFCSCREPLLPQAGKKIVILVCQQCGAWQGWVPEVVYEAWELHQLREWCGVCE